MEGMNDEAKRELRALRERAYGPTADIDTDAAAAARLAELEALLHPAPEPEPVIESEPEPEPEDDPFAEMGLANDDAEPAPPTPPRLSKRMKMWWIGSVAVAVILAVVITAFVSRRVQADPQEVAVLSVNPLAEWPSDLLGINERDGRMFMEYLGLVPIATEYPTSPGAEVSVCLNVVSAEALENATNGSMNGPWFSGCGAGGFPATTQFIVGPILPDELRDVYPDGTALQFQILGDEVLVLADVPEDGAT